MGKLKKRFLANYQVDESTARLPKEYQEVEYIESSGTQWIDLGVQFRVLPFVVNVVASLIVQSTDNNMLMGVSDGAVKQTDIRATNTSWEASGGTLTSDNTPNNKTNLILNSNSVAQSNNHHTILFGFNQFGNIVKLSHSKVYSYKYYENNTLMKCLVPCYRKADNEAGLYDLANGVFYANAGTGSFSVGEPVYYLPTEFQEVEYITSDGSSYIDTNLIPTSTTNFEISCEASNLSEYSYLLGTRNTNSSSSDIYAMFMRTSNKSYMALGLANGSYDTSVGGNLAQKGVWKKTNNSLYYNDTLIGTTTSYSVSLTYPLYLFGANVNGSYSVGVYGGTPNIKLYSCKLYNGTTLQRSFKPCYRKSDQVIGLYDCVNDVFYTNSGTGTFAKGENVYYTLPKEYQKVEWIESSGTQYINTGYKMSSQKERIVGTFMLYPSTQYVSYFGSNGSNGYSILVWNTGNGSSKWASLYIGSDNYTILPNLLNTTKYTFDITADNGNYTYSINNSITGNGTYTGSIDTANNIFIFGKNNGSSIERGNGNRVYSFMLYDNDVLVRDFVPCYRKNGGEIGLYDIVNGTFYANSGTGSFTKGADVI